MVNKYTCKYVLKYGSKKGAECGKGCRGDFCKQHNPKAQEKKKQYVEVIKERNMAGLLGEIKRKIKDGEGVNIGKYINTRTDLLADAKECVRIINGIDIYLDNTTPRRVEKKWRLILNSSQYNSTLSDIREEHEGDDSYTEEDIKHHALARFEMFAYQMGVRPSFIEYEHKKKGPKPKAIKADQYEKKARLLKEIKMYTEIITFLHKTENKKYK